MLATFMAPDRDNHHLSGWFVLSIIISHHEKCVCVSPWTISHKAFHHPYLHKTLSNPPSIHPGLYWRNQQRPDPPWMRCDNLDPGLTWPPNLCACVFCMFPYKINKQVVCMLNDGRSQGIDGGGKKNLTLTLGALHLLSAYLSLSVFYPSSSSFPRHLPPPPSPASMNSRRVRNGAGIHLGGRRERKLPLTALIAFTHTHGGKKKLPPPSPPPHAT